MLAGEDAQIFSTVAEGGVGAIAASGHLQTARFVDVIQRLREGRLAEARSLWQPLLPLIECLFAEPNPAPVKAALALERPHAATHPAGTQGGGRRTEARPGGVSCVRNMHAALRWSHGEACVSASP